MCVSEYSAKWKDIEGRLIEGLPIQAILRDETLRAHLKQKINPWLGVSVKIWSEIVKKYNLTGHCRFLRWIAHDIDFIPNKLDGRFKLWNNGPKMYWEVIKNKTVMSFQKMKEVYGLQKQDFHRYLQLRQNCNRRN